MRFQDKVAVIAGAGSIRAGMGNGKATAVSFAKEGAKVVAIDKNLDAAKETVKIILDHGGKAIALQADVTKASDAKAAVEAAISEYGKLDILFNNVGIADGTRGLSVPEEEWDLVMNVNLKSILFMCQAVVPEMRKRGGGAIVNNASMAAFYGFPVYAYSVSKAGVIGLTKSLAVSLAKDNIRVNCVAPGMIDTPMMAPSQNEQRRKGVELRVPLKRQGVAEEIAGTVLFLASPEASYITGQTICVDGGLSAF